MVSRRDFLTSSSAALLVGVPGLAQTPRYDLVIKGGRGTLKTGAVADVSVLELAEGQFEFNDNSSTIRKGTRKLLPRAVVFGGKVWKGTMSTSGLAAR
jgi:predicted amidohydrolase